jgi:hypothetical protein
VVQLCSDTEDFEPVTLPRKLLGLQPVAVGGAAGPGRVAGGGRRLPGPCALRSRGPPPGPAAWLPRPPAVVSLGPPVPLAPRPRPPPPPKQRVVRVEFFGHSHGAILLGLAAELYNLPPSVAVIATVDKQADTVTAAAAITFIDIDGVPTPVVHRGCHFVLLGRNPDTIRADNPAVDVANIDNAPYAVSTALDFASCTLLQRREAGRVTGARGGWAGAAAMWVPADRRLVGSCCAPSPAVGGLAEL